MAAAATHPSDDLRKTLNRLRSAQGQLGAVIAAVEPVPEETSTAPVNDSALQKRVVRVLVAGQILGGIGMGATLSLGALLAAELSGSSAWSGMAATMSTLGAAGRCR